jgi:anti-anti-sigma factor
MSERQALELSVERNAGESSATLALAGELDISTAEQLQQAVSKLLAEDGARELTVDLRRLIFIDSSGLAAMLFTSKQCERFECRLSVIPGSPTVHSVFELTGLHELLPFDGDAGGAQDASPS